MSWTWPVTWKDLVGAYSNCKIAKVSLGFWFQVECDGTTAICSLWCITTDGRHYQKNYLILWATQKTTIHLCATYRVPMDINSDQGIYLIAVKFRNESESEVAQLRPILCDPVDSSSPGSSVHGIIQARSSGMGQYKWHTWAFPSALQLHCCWAMNRLLKQ